MFDWAEWAQNDIQNRGPPGPGSVATEHEDEELSDDEYDQEMWRQYRRRRAWVRSANIEHCGK